MLPHRALQIQKRSKDLLFGTTGFLRILRASSLQIALETEVEKGLFQ